MKGLVITIIVVLAALVVAGFLIFSGNNYSSDQIQNQAPENSGQTGTQQETNQTGTGSPEQTQTQSQTYNIEIKGYAFNPSALNVKVGDIVVWTNEDSVSHTVTSDSGTELNSPYLSKGNSYSHTFETAGTYKYHCRPHPYMKGTIVVE